MSSSTTSNDKKAAKAGLWYTIANFLSKGAVYLTIPFFTRLMSEEAMGDFSNASSWLTMLIPLVTFDMFTSMKVARFDYEDEFDKYNSSITFYSTLIAAVFYGIVLLNMNFFVDFFSMSPFCIHILFIYMLVRPALDIFQAQSNIRYKYKASAFVTLLATGLSLALALLLVQVVDDQVAGRVAGTYGVYIIICIGLYIYLMFKGRGVSFKYLKYSINISFPLMWHALSMHLLASCSRVVIKRTLGSAANGLYSVAYTCSHVVSLIYHATNMAWSPWAIAQMHEGNIDKMKKASRMYVLLFSVAVGALLLICPELLWILGGDTYMKAKFVMPPAMLAVVPQFVYSVYIDAEFYLKKQKLIAVGTISAAILSLILNILLVPTFGYVAAAYVTVIGYLALMFFHMAVVYKSGKMHWFNNRFNMIIVAAAMAFIPVANFLYMHNVVRYIVTGVVAIVTMVLIVKFRNKIKPVVGMFIGRASKKK